jgi:two-component system, cell cycle response regulator DivK
MNLPAASPAPLAPGQAACRELTRVLIVDDYADSRELYREYLDLAGFKVDVATDGLTAVERARAGLPDVILMDLSLPLLDGWDAIKLIKDDPLTSGIRVIAFTGHVMPEHLARAREAGCDDVCSKPCMPDDVERKIRRLVEAASPAGV